MPREASSRASPNRERRFPVGTLVCGKMPPEMAFFGLDTAAISRALAQLAEHHGDEADAYLERQEVLTLPAEGEPPGLRLWREEGFALRLTRGEASWSASRDGLTPLALAAALRQVARALPRTPFSLPTPVLSGFPPLEVGAIGLFPSLVAHKIRERRVGFPFSLKLHRHRRWLQVVGTQLVGELEQERYFSWEASLPWETLGGLADELDEDLADHIAHLLVVSFRGREAQPPPAGFERLLLAPDAAAVLLHEVVAHALEADALARAGSIQAAIGAPFGPSGLNVIDDPASGPEGRSRMTDDEGIPVAPRWLIRDGVVEQPLADSSWARRTPALAPGCARRSDRHHLPAPRSSRLELLSWDNERAKVLELAEGGLFVERATHGNLDPLRGRFSMLFPGGRRVRAGALAEPVGPFLLTGAVADVVGSIIAIGKESRPAGAGWCAKDGMLLPVWASTPEILLSPVEISPWR